MARRFRLLFSALMVLGAAGLLAGCSTKGTPTNDYKETPVETLYNRAMNDLADKNWSDAAKDFAEVDRQHPTSTWATKAQLMGAYANYQADKLDDAISQLNRYIQLHPGSQDVAYAYYLKAICYYEQISDVERDQENAVQALGALQNVVDRFPNSVYARDSRFRINTVRDHLAGRDMEIGRFYERDKEILAAINRFRSVVDNYQTTSQVPEALYRLVECYEVLGLTDEAARDAAVLGYNYPGSSWYEDAYKLLSKTSPAVVARYSSPAVGIVRSPAVTPVSTLPETRVGPPGAPIKDQSDEVMKSAPDKPAAAGDRQPDDSTNQGEVSKAWSDFTDWLHRMY